jgi:hypothetical protein
MTLQCLPFDHVDPQVSGQVPFSENPTGDLQDQRMDEISALSMQADVQPRAAARFEGIMNGARHSHLPLHGNGNV